MHHRMQGRIARVIVGLDSPTDLWGWAAVAGKLPSGAAASAEAGGEGDGGAVFALDAAALEEFASGRVADAADAALLGFMLGGPAATAQCPADVLWPETGCGGSALHCCTVHARVVRGQPALNTAPHHGPPAGSYKFERYKTARQAGKRAGARLVCPEAANRCAPGPRRGGGPRVPDARGGGANQPPHNPRAGPAPARWPAPTSLRATSSTPRPTTSAPNTWRARRRRWPRRTRGRVSPSSRGRPCSRPATRRSTPWGEPARGERARQRARATGLRRSERGWVDACHPGGLRRAAKELPSFMSRTNRAPRGEAAGLLRL